MYVHLNEPAAHLRRLAYQRAGAESAATRRAVRSGARQAAICTRHTTFPIKPDMTERAAEIGERYGKILHDLPGHVSTVMFVDGDAFTSISTWDDEQLSNAVADTRNAAQRDLSDLLSGAPSTTITRTVVHDAH